MPDNLKEYKKQLRKKLSSLESILPNVAMGNFSKKVKIPEKEDDFFSLFVAINLMIDDLEEMQKENQQKTAELLEQKEKEAIRRGEEKYRMIVERSQDLIMMTRPDGVVDYLSPAAKNVIGYDPQELVGQRKSVVYKEDFSRVESELSKALKGKSGSGLEYRVKTKEGKIKWVSHSWSPILEGKQLKLIISVVRDITKNKEYEKRIKVFQELVEQSNQGLGYADLKGKVIFANRKLAVDLAGEKTVENMIGKNIIQYYSDSQKAKLEKKILPQVLKTGDWTGEIPLMDKNGKFHDLMQSIFLLKDENNKPLYFSNILTDISQLKKTERELAESREKFESILNNVTVGILAADPKNSAFLFANDYMSKISGYTKEELAKMNVAKIVPKKDRPKIAEIFKKQARGQLRLAQEIPILRNDGKIIYCDILATPLVIADKKILLGVFNETTERREREKEIKNKVKELESMNKLMVGRELKMIELKERIKKINKKMK